MKIPAKINACSQPQAFQADLSSWLKGSLNPVRRQLLAGFFEACRLVGRLVDSLEDDFL